MTDRTPSAARVLWRALLTPNEAAVVELVAQGLTNAEIAERLFYSTSSVDSRLRDARRSLGARNRVEAARWWWRNVESKAVAL